MTTPGIIEVQRNINELREAADEETVRRLMTVTYDVRRHALVEEGATIEDLRQRYPQLFTPDEVGIGDRAQTRSEI